MSDPSESFLNANQALSSGHPDAVARLKELAKSGDPHAQMALGELYVTGKRLNRSFAKGFQLIQKAAKQGLIEARRTEIYFTAKGIGRNANPMLARNMLARLATEDPFANVQSKLLANANSRAKISTLEPEILSDSPRILIWRGLFSEAEYGYLRHIGVPKLEPAMVVNPATGKGRLDPIRRSHTCSFSLIEEDLLLQEILGTIAIATDTRVSQGEPLSILRYRIGEEYRNHYDAYGGSWKGPQRKYTALIWLNDGFEGGETHFPRIGLSVKGAPGDLLVFTNIDEEGRRDDRMEHASLPVTQGEKWLASRWILVSDTNKLSSFG